MGRSAKSKATTSGTAMDPDSKPPASKRKASEIGGKKPKRQRKMSTAPDGASNSRVKTRATGPRAQWAIPFPHLLRERDRK